MSSDSIASLSIVFIGAGRVAETLARAMHHAGLHVVSVYSRNHRHADAIATTVPGMTSAGSVQAAADEGDLIFLTVPDDAIAPVCASLAWRAGQFVVHCSGATEVVALNPAAAAGALVGAFHPLQMFANPSVALETLPGCTITIDAASPLAEHLEAICTRIGGRPLRLPAGQRALYHASANYVGPFLIALMREAAAMWRVLGASEQETLDALVPLLQGTVAAVVDGGLARGMGGCIARGDVGTVKRHLAALDAVSPEMTALYRTLSLRTIPLGLERGTLSADAAEAIRAVLEAHESPAGTSSAKSA